MKLQAARVHARLPASYETALYRVLQGALSNVAEHARAKNVSVELAGGRAMLRMSIRDDGAGFNVDHRFRAPHRGFGLRAMRERIEALGGTFRIESRPARSRRGRTGTTVVVELPRQDRVRP